MAMPQGANEDLVVRRAREPRERPGRRRHEQDVVINITGSAAAEQRRRQRHHGGSERCAGPGEPADRPQVGAHGRGRHRRRAERGGDAGISHTSPAASTTNASGADNKPSSTSLDQKSKGSSEEIEDGSNAKSKSEGSGEKYVKSSGLKIDGGDFDVTKPGAGREADREFFPFFLFDVIVLSIARHTPFR